MAVYIDRALIPFGRMMMSHMIADSTAELLAMGKRIGVSTKWIQDAGTYREHFDVCAAKRKLAIECGAKEIDSHELAEILRRRKRGQTEIREQSKLLERYGVEQNV